MLLTLGERLKPYDFKPQFRGEGWRKVMTVTQSIVAVVVMAALAVLTGCSTGGYVQIGWIPVNDVVDTHSNILEAKRKKDI